MAFGFAYLWYKAVDNGEDTVDGIGSSEDSEEARLLSGVTGFQKRG